MKSKQYVFLSNMWKSGEMQQLGFWGQIELPCDPKTPSLLTAPAEPLNLPWEPQLLGTSLWTHSRRPAAPPGSTPSPSLQRSPQTFQTVTIDWRRLLRGLKPPTAAARLVNGSTLADHLRAAGGGSLESCSCVPARLLRSTVDHKGGEKKKRRLRGPLRLSRKWKVRKLETFKVTGLMKDWLWLLYLTGAALHGALSNSRRKKKKAPQDLRAADGAAEKKKKKKKKQRKDLCNCSKTAWDQVEFLNFASTSWDPLISSRLDEVQN